MQIDHPDFDFLLVLAANQMAYPIGKLAFYRNIFTDITLSIFDIYTQIN